MLGLRPKVLARICSFQRAIDWIGHKPSVDWADAAVACGYYDGLYVWNPERHAIMFLYSDAQGSLYEGTVRIEGEKLVHEFQEIHTDGKIDPLLARVTPHGTDSWDNAIFARKNGALVPLVQVQYLPAR